MTTETTAMDTKQDAPLSTTEPTRGGRMYRPNVDIVELPTELLLQADMPGTTGADIDIQFENGTLTIHGKVRPRQERTDYVLREYGVGDYYREFRVSEAIDGQQISAEYQQGVLTLHLPKVAAVQPRKIAVKAD